MNRISAEGLDFVNGFCDGDIGPVAGIYHVPGREGFIVAEAADGRRAPCHQWRMEITGGGFVENLYMVSWCEDPLEVTVEALVAEIEHIFAQGEVPQDPLAWSHFFMERASKQMEAEVLAEIDHCWDQVEADMYS